MNGIINSGLAYLQAFETISRLRLWGYFLLPAAISVVLGIAIFGTAWGISGNIGDWIISWYPFEFGRGILENIATVFGAIFIIAIGLIIFKQLVMALSAPFMSPMSEMIEKDIKGEDVSVPFSTTQFIQDLIRGLRIAIRNIVRELFFTFILFLIGLIPIFTPFTTALIFIVQAYYAGFGNMDYTLERHMNVRNSVRFVRRNWTVALGNGAVFILLLFTGIGFLLVIPLGAAAATPTTVDRLAK